MHMRLHSQEPASRPERRGSMVGGGASALRSSALQRWQRVASWWAGEAHESLQDGVDSARCGLGQVTYEPGQFLPPVIMLLPIILDGFRQVNFHRSLRHMHRRHAGS